MSQEKQGGSSVLVFMILLALGGYVAQRNDWIRVDVNLPDLSSLLQLEVEPEYPEPDFKTQKAVEALSLIPGAGKAAPIYWSMAEVLEGDGQGQQVVRNTSIARSFLMNSALLNGVRGIGTGDVMVEIIAQQMGMDVVPLDSKKRSQLVDLLRGAAWACSQAGS